MMSRPPADPFSSSGRIFAKNDSFELMSSRYLTSIPVAWVNLSSVEPGPSTVPWDLSMYSGPVEIVSGSPCVGVVAATVVSALVSSPLPRSVPQAASAKVARSPATATSTATTRLGGRSCG